MEAALLKILEVVSRRNMAKINTETKDIIKATINHNKATGIKDTRRHSKALLKVTTVATSSSINNTRNNRHSRTTANSPSISKADNHINSTLRVTNTDKDSIQPTKGTPAGKDMDSNIRNSSRCHTPAQATRRMGLEADRQLRVIEE